MTLPLSGAMQTLATGDQVTLGRAGFAGVCETRPDRVTYFQRCVVLPGTGLSHRQCLQILLSGVERRELSGDDRKVHARFGLEFGQER